MAWEALVHDPAGPAHLVHDGRALAVALLDAGRVHEDRERADEPHATLDHQRDVLVTGQQAVLDRPHALLDGQSQAGPAVGVGGSVSSGPMRLFDGGADLLARVGARGRHGAGRADAAGDEDLHVVGTATEVLARAAADLVDAIVAGERPAVAVVGGETAARHQETRPGDHARLDGIAHVDVEEVFLAHHSHRRRPGGEVSTQVDRGGERLRHGPAAELAELIAEARDDRGVAVAVDEPGHHEAIREIEWLGAGRRGRAVDWSNGRDPIPVDDDHRVANRHRGDAVEEGSAADRADAHARQGLSPVFFNVILRTTQLPVPSLTLSHPRSSRSEISWSSTLFVVDDANIRVGAPPCRSIRACRAFTLLPVVPYSMLAIH